MRVWIIEPYCTGSHLAWAEGYARATRHRASVLCMAGRFWKWRMQGGAMELARQAFDLMRQGECPDVILASDMLNLPAFLSLIGSI